MLKDFFFNLMTNVFFIFKCNIQIQCKKKIVYFTTSSVYGEDFYQPKVTKNIVNTYSL